MKQDQLNQHVIDAFTADSKVNTLQNLLDPCTCSEVTLRRKIKQIGLLTSYNHNSKFYTLPSLASFDAHGIWDCEGICFSAHGSLVNTIIKLVHNSKAGCKPTELSSILRVKVNDLLRLQTARQTVRRKKAGRGYVYYSSDETVYATQHRERELLIAASSSQKGDALMDDKDIVIAILVEIILSGNLDEEAIERRLKAKGIDAGVKEIQAVIAHYGIKKTMRKF
ncbi:MAG: hypothetical protein ACC651_17615 [Candidatus Scalindua sp.]